MGIYEHAYSAHGCQKRALDPLKLDSWAVVSCPTWVLQPKLRSSARAVHTLSLRIASSAHWFVSEKGFPV